MGRRSDPRWRDEAAATLLARHAGSLGLDGPALVMGDPLDDVPRALREQGVEVAVWRRRALGGRAASPWPAPAAHATVAVRLPPARDELEMTLHAAVSALRPGGRLLVYGARDEGVGSAGARMAPLVGEVETAATGGRCRILVARRPRVVEGLRGSLEAWRQPFLLPLPELPSPWVSYPGVFARGRLDEGTLLLLESLPRVKAHARVLDFGCGSGVVGAVVRARSTAEGDDGAAGACVDFLDVDAVALDAVALNVPGARTVLGDGLAPVAGERYDLVVSNPPFHEGKAESLDALAALVEEAPGVLARRGELVLVALRRLPLEGMLQGRFRHVRAVADDGRLYRVWRAAAPGEAAA